MQTHASYGSYIRAWTEIVSRKGVSWDKKMNHLYTKPSLEVRRAIRVIVLYSNMRWVVTARSRVTAAERHLTDPRWNDES